MSHFSLFVYVFQPSIYQDVNKRNPKCDFLITAVLAMFWLAGAAAWANGLTGLKWAANTENWLDPGDGAPGGGAPPTPWR